MTADERDRPAAPAAASQDATTGRAKAEDSASQSVNRSQDDDLTARIEAAQKALHPEPEPSAAEKYHALTMAWRMTLELVVGAGFGFALGWGLDSLFGTKPLFLLLLGLLGFAAGIKLVYETARGGQRPPHDAER